MYKVSSGRNKDVKRLGDETLNLTALELIKINKSFSHQKRQNIVLNDASLKIPYGSIFGMVGESGAGKSTLLRCMNLLERPDSGAVVLGDQDLTLLSAKQLREKRKTIPMIFQGFDLIANKKVFDNIALPLVLCGTSDEEIKSKVNTICDVVGLGGKQDFYPRQLSGGQQQRVSIARSLVCEPQVLLCDEATSALDPQTTENILQLLAEINRSRGITIVLVTHEPEVVRSICTHLAVIEDGRVKTQTSMEELKSQKKGNTLPEELKIFVS